MVKCVIGEVYCGLFIWHTEECVGPCEDDLNDDILEETTAIQVFMISC